MEDINTFLLFILIGVVYMAYTLKKIRQEIFILNERVNSIPDIFKSPAEVAKEMGIYKEED